MRVAIFTDTFSPQINGVTNTLGYLSGYLKCNGIDHMFFVPDYDTEKSQDLSSLILRFKGLAPFLYPECRLVFPNHGQTLERVAAFGPDVIHIVSELGIGYAGLKAARDLNIPIVMSYHTNYDKYLDFYNLSYLSKPVWAYLRWFHSFARVNLCPSENTVKELKARGFTDLDIWSRGIDTGVFSPGFRSQALREALGTQDQTVFLYVGRIAREKGLDTLAQSIGLLNATHGGKASFVFTGDGPYLEELRSMGLENAVFTGALRGRALSEVYASCDAFVFPSGTETFGNVMLEAMASGLPGICVDAGGVTDFTRHLDNAYVYQFGSAVSLAQALEAMLNPMLRSAIRKGALRTAAERDWDSILGGLMAHYEAACGAPPLKRLAG